MPHARICDLGEVQPCAEKKRCTGRSKTRRACLMYILVDPGVDKCSQTLMMVLRGFVALTAFGKAVFSQKIRTADLSIIVPHPYPPPDSLGLVTIIITPGICHLLNYHDHQVTLVPLFCPFWTSLSYSYPPHLTY